ncbi:unnamed protein product [Chrysodeixis includens]|uniref:Peptidase S1 domain-containing protein n=1 Tax=Chrysodeixis includens TaxID=689277 RepID=A0A9P0G044_CHRIL|nr:unnamed protein product [Chrysodeixis includens]
MKVLITLACLALAIAASAEEIVEKETSPVFNYHLRFGVDKASKIKAAEEQSAVSGQRIVGGSISDISETPYQAGLVIQIFVILTSVCGASIIGNDRVLTAAHCNYDGRLTANSFTVVLGSNFLFSGGRRIVTRDVVMHPEWDPNTTFNDVAIIRLGEVISYSNVVQPIALPSGDYRDNDFNGWDALASGYGQTRDGVGIGNNQQLSSVTLPVIDNLECAAVYGSFVRHTNVCTSGADGQGTCHGDSGGPLAVTSLDQKILIGVTSFGAQAGCAAGYPAAYTRVTWYIDWIRSLNPTIIGG